MIFHYTLVRVPRPSLIWHGSSLYDPSTPFLLRPELTCRSWIAQKSRMNQPLYCPLRNPKHCQRKTTRLVLEAQKIHDKGGLSRGTESLPRCRRRSRPRPRAVGATNCATHTATATCRGSGRDIEEAIAGLGSCEGILCQPQPQGSVYV